MVYTFSQRKAVGFDNKDYSRWAVILFYYLSDNTEKTAAGFLALSVNDSI